MIISGLYIQLVNHLGEKGALETLAAINNKAITIQKISQKIQNITKRRILFFNNG